MSLNFTQTFKCASCGEDPYLSVPLRASCVECPAGLELCLECLASRVELGQHKAAHKYRLVDNGGLQLLGSSWTCKELVQLLDGLEQFGHGNWSDVARYVETKGPGECREAVNNLFVSGPIGVATWKEEQRGSARDHTAPPSVSSGTIELGAAGLTEVILLGCLPVREDFEVEHCNEAESLVSAIEPGGGKGEEEDEVEVACKLAQVEMYKEKLKERERRRTVAREFGLIDAFFKENPLNPATGKLNPPKPKKKDPRTDVLERLKVMSGVQGVEEHKKLVASVTKEKELKTRIKELIRYRKNGIHQLSEAEQYEAQRVRRNRKKAERKRLLEGGEAVVEEQEVIKEESCGSGVPDLDSITSIGGLPGHEVLSANEKRLCTSLRLHPRLYISYKACLLRDHLSKKKGQIPKPVHPSGLDKLHRKKIFNFLLHSGWISAY